MRYETPLFFHVMQYAAESDRDVVDVVSGNPDWPPPEGIREGLRDHAASDATEFQYPASAGLLPLRREIADRRNVDVDRVIVTTGTGEANYLGTARALERDAGDEVPLTDPVYPYYPGKSGRWGRRSGSSGPGLTATSIPMPSGRRRRWRRHISW